MPASVHIALFVPDLSGGGAERVMLNLAHGFVERGINTDLVLLNAEGPYKDKVDERINIHDLGVARAAGSIGPLVHYLRHQQPDALISALGQTNLAALLAKRLSTTRIPILVTEHQSFQPGRETGFRQRIFPRLARWLYPSGKVVAVSEGVADTMAQVIGLPRQDITVIPNPVLTDDLQSLAAEPLPMGVRRPYVLGMGRLTAQKNFPLLLDAFRRMAEQRPDLNLVILGDGPDRSALEAGVRELGLQERVSLPGFQANPYPWLKGAAAFALSSDWEGLPTVLIEALALDVPVVATDCESGPREILGSGRLGRLVPVNDAPALAAALLEAAAETGNPATPADLTPYTVRSATSAYLRALGLPG